jgi:hypothetical protein
MPKVSVDLLSLREGVWPELMFSDVEKHLVDPVILSEEVGALVEPFGDRGPGGGIHPAAGLECRCVLIS